MSPAPGRNPGARTLWSIRFIADGHLRTWGKFGTLKIAANAVITEAKADNLSGIGIVCSPQGVQYWAARFVDGTALPNDVTTGLPS